MEWDGSRGKWFITSGCGRYRVCKALVFDVPVYTAWANIGSAWPTMLTTSERLEEAKCACDEHAQTTK